MLNYAKSFIKYAFGCNIAGFNPIAFLMGELSMKGEKET